MKRPNRNPQAEQAFKEWLESKAQHLGWSISETLLRYRMETNGEYPTEQAARGIWAESEMAKSFKNKRRRPAREKGSMKRDAEEVLSLFGDEVADRPRTLYTLLTKYGWSWGRASGACTFARRLLAEKKASSVLAVPRVRSEENPVLLVPSLPPGAAGPDVDLRRSELEAMIGISRILSKCTEEERVRILDWASQAYISSGTK